MSTLFENSSILSSSLKGQNGNSINILSLIYIPAIMHVDYEYYTPDCTWLHTFTPYTCPQAPSK